VWTSRSRGAVTALVGHNGAGKSTLLRCAAARCGPSGPRAVGRGEVTRWSPHRRAGRAHLRARRGERVLHPHRWKRTSCCSAAAADRRIGHTVTETFPELRPHLLQRAGTLSGRRASDAGAGACARAPSRVLAVDDVAVGSRPGYGPLRPKVSAGPGHPERVVVVCEQFSTPHWPTPTSSTSSVAPRVVRPVSRRVARVTGGT